MKLADLIHELAPYLAAILALLAAVTSWLKADATRRHADAQVSTAVAAALEAYRADLAQAQQAARDLAAQLRTERAAYEMEHARLLGALRGKEARIADLETRIVQLEEQLERAERREAALAAELKERARADRAGEHLRLIDER